MTQVLITRVTQEEDRVACEGTVDGAATSCTVSNSVLVTLADDAERQRYITEQLINSLPAPIVNRKELVTAKALAVETVVEAGTGKMAATAAKEA